MVRIDTKTGRDKLKARREPYWLRLETGRFLGFRRTPQSGFWLARFRDAEGQQRYQSLGEVTALEYDDAKRAADAWFRTFDKAGGMAVKVGTVAAAAEAYADNLATEGRTAAAADARARFKKLLKDSPLGQTRLDKLTREAVTKWRDGLLTEDRGQAAVNRNLRTLKAALNEAVRLGYATHPEAWRTVRAFAQADGSRDLFLTVKQRRALMAEASPPLKDFIAAMLHTAARPGELTRATVADFDKAHNNLTLRTQKGRGGKLRTRVVPLTAEGAKLLKRVTKRKLPAAPLLANGQGGFWHRVELSRAIRAAATAAKLPAGVCGYTMRHTAISEWLSAGVDPVTTAKLAGTSVVMIEKFYAKFIAAPTMDKLESVKLL